LKIKLQPENEVQDALGPLRVFWIYSTHMLMAVLYLTTSVIYTYICVRIYIHMRQTSHFWHERVTGTHSTLNWIVIEDFILSLSLSLTHTHTHTRQNLLKEGR
jgi:hypothetical protein